MSMVNGRNSQSGYIKNGSYILDNHTSFIPPVRNSLVFDSEKGKLYKFSPDSIDVIRLGSPWPATYSKTARVGTWQNKIPAARFPFLFSKPYPMEDNLQNEALKKYLAYTGKLYEEVRDWIGEKKVSLIEQYQLRHWFMFCLLFHGGERSQELTISNPALAWLISAHAVFHPLSSKQYWRSVRSLLQKKRRDVLDYFGFPEREATVNLFSRIRPFSCSSDIFFILRKHLCESPELLRQLSFFPVHNSTSIRIMCSKLRPYFSFHALNSIAELEPRNTEPELNQKLLDVLGMRSILVANGNPQPWFWINSLAELDTIHAELVDKLNTESLDHDVVYDSPPLPDIKRNSLWIECIHRSSDLLREGREMRHCIYSYHHGIVRGDYFVARMLVPERLTLLCRVLKSYTDNERSLELVEARGPFNEQPNPNSVHLIGLWLRRLNYQIWDPDQLTIFEGYEIDNTNTIREIVEC